MKLSTFSTTLALALVSRQATAFVLPSSKSITTTAVNMAKAAAICPEVPLATGGNTEIALVALG